jgi:multimeric flavodoxin WrbA
VEQRRFLFVVGSSRKDGNSETLARLAADRLPGGTPQRWLRLSELEVPPFRDSQRKHDPVPEPDGVERLLLDETLQATDLVLVTPLYWYSPSWDMKLYLDHWATWERLPGLDFKTRMSGKTLWAVTVMADDDKAVAEPLLKVLALSTGYLGARFAGALLGTGSWPGDVLKDTGALERARTFFAALWRVRVQGHGAVLASFVVEQRHLVDARFQQGPPVLPQPALCVSLTREDRLLQGRVVHHGPVGLLVPPRPGHDWGSLPRKHPCARSDTSVRGDGCHLESGEEEDGPDRLAAADHGAPAPYIADRVYHAQASAGLVATGGLAQHGSVVTRVEDGAHHLT